jgi:hypothetical protein
MTDQPDPERLLAEALRAQAVRAPVSGRPADAPAGSSDPLRLFSGAASPYELLSGQESYEVEPSMSATESGYTARLERSRPLSVWWIVSLAVLLGLAAGAVVGLVTVL